MPAIVDKYKLPTKLDRRRKLTLEDEEMIRHLYKSGDFSLMQLAKKFKVSKKLILLKVNPEAKRKNDLYIKENWHKYVDRKQLTEAKRNNTDWKRQHFDELIPNNGYLWKKEKKYGTKISN